MKKVIPQGTLKTINKLTYCSARDKSSLVSVGAMGAIAPTDWKPSDIEQMSFIITKPF